MQFQTAIKEHFYLQLFMLLNSMIRSLYERLKLLKYLSTVLYV